MASENVVELNDSNFDSVPTLLFITGGEKKDQTVGLLGKAEIVRRLEALAGAGFAENPFLLLASTGILARRRAHFIVQV